MNRFKKAISVGMSATLLASLFTVIAAGSAMASITGTSAGSVAQGTTSTGEASYLFTENSIAALPNAAGSMTVTITPAAPGVGTVSWSGTPVVSAPGSLGASASVAGNVLTINVSGSDVLNVETISISGLKVTASATASPGAVVATLSAGLIGTAFSGGTTTAAGKLAQAYGIGTTQFDVALDVGSCPFSGTNTVTVGGESVTVTGVTADSPVVGQYRFANAGDPFVSNQLANAIVTQTVPNCNVLSVPSPATVVQALAYTSPQGNVNVFPGENNQLAGNLQVAEPAAGFLAAGTTVTFTIKTAGVLFSSPPTATVTAGNLLLTSGSASSEVQTVTLAGGGAADTFTLSFGAATTGAIAFNATAATVDTALEGLAGIGAGNVAVTGADGGPYTVTFTGTLANSNVAQLVAATTDVAPAGPFTATVATLTGGGSTLGVALSADRTAVTITVATASTTASTVVLSNIRYDVASTVPSGTLVTVEATASGGRIVNPATRTNAQVGRIFNASAPTPNVNIGQNGQAAGLITIVEVTAGAFTDGTGPNNIFQICPDGTASFTSPGPIATVTGGVAAGNLILREGAAASTDNVVPGTPNPAAPGCYYWTVWTKSTTASTITIGSSATVGPLVNVLNNVPAGALNATLSAGTLGALVTQVSLHIANRVFSAQVSVSAASQPIIAPGAVHALAGDIVVMETGNGQLKLGQTICVEIVPNQQTNILPDVFLSGLTTADLPTATASNGIVVSSVSMSPNTCQGLSGTPGTLFESFQFTINQQSTTGNGTVRISNIHYSAVNDAATGPVQVNVWGFNVGGASIDFQRIISNASINTTNVLGRAHTRLGVTQIGSFTVSTKVPAVGKYVTYRFDFGVGAAGKIVQIWGATKTGNDWSAFTVITARRANASGVVYYHIRHNSATWRSYRGFYSDGGSWTPARQARWLNQ